MDESSIIHPLHISKTISQILPRDILEIKKVGRGKVQVFLKSFDAANKLASNSSLASHNLKAFVPSYRILRAGIIRDIPQDFSPDILKEVISSPLKIIEIHRLNRRIKVGNEFQYVPSRTICIKFAGQSLPPYIYFYNCRYPVYPYVPKARICYACFRIGHLRKACKSKPRCLHCGDPVHEPPEDCPNRPASPRCLNCGGNHLATSHDCPEVIKHKMALSLAANDNISYLEARRSVNSSSPTLSSPFSSRPSLDPRFDFHNFPQLPRTSTQSRSPPLANRFSPLADLPQHDFLNLYPNNSAHGKPYSQAVRYSQPPVIPNSHFPPRSRLHADLSSNSRSPPLSRPPFPPDHQAILLEPNGRSSFSSSQPLPVHNSPHLLNRIPSDSGPLHPGSDGSFEQLFQLLNAQISLFQQLFSSFRGFPYTAIHNEDFPPLSHQDHNILQDSSSTSRFHIASSQL